MKVSRRDFVKTVGASAAYVSFCGAVWKARTLEPAKDIENPLAQYPDRNWERIYRDQYRYDSSFTYVQLPCDCQNQSQGYPGAHNGRPASPSTPPSSARP